MSTDDIGASAKAALLPNNDIVFLFNFRASLKICKVNARKLKKSKKNLNKKQRNQNQ